MKRYIGIVTIVILVLTIFAILTVLPNPDFFGRKKFQQGLDLQGGAQLTYEFDLSNIGDRTPEEAQSGVIDVLDRRVNILGVSEPVIQGARIGQKYGVIVELPGLQNPEEAKTIIGKTAQLKFLEQKDNQWVETELTGAYLREAKVDYQSNKSVNASFAGSAPVVTLTLDGEGAKMFKDITERNLQKPVAIQLDEEIISAPTVQSVIEDGNAIITGLEISEAKQLAKLLNAGALPVPIKLVSENQIGATLGKDSIQKSLVAGIFGLMLVTIFMIVYYRLPGVLATIALGIYTLIVLAIFKLIPVTLTLAGIAGFIFSVGAAVDANILIFERLKEELRAGRAKGEAMEESFRRSWSSIWPSNMASLITAAILFYGTSGMVRGFAVTLGIGILVSMFSAITVTRTLMRTFYR